MRRASISTVLIIDSSEAEASRLAEELHCSGLDVARACSMIDARQLLGAYAFDLAIVDVTLREAACKNGLALARDIKATHPWMRIVLTSSHHCLSERQLERLDFGVSGFIPKPYDVDEAVRVVRSLLLSGGPSSRRLWHPEPRSSGRFRTGVPSPTAFPLRES